MATAVADPPLNAIPSRMDQSTCPWCQQLIGVYEPTIVLTSDRAVLTGSRPTLGPSLGGADSVAAHAECHPVDGKSMHAHENS